jgi:hypothetical protein
MLNLRNLRATLSPYPARIRARHTYFTVNDHAANVYQLLNSRDGQTARGRALLLLDLADLESLMASILPTAWPSTESVNDAAVLRASAELLHIIATTEDAHGPEYRRRGPDAWEDAFGTLLDDLADTPTLAERAALMVRLYLAAHPVIGSEAAATIESLRSAYVDLALTAAPLTSA